MKQTTAVLALLLCMADGASWGDDAARTSEWKTDLSESGPALFTMGKDGVLTFHEGWKDITKTVILPGEWECWRNADPPFVWTCQELKREP